MAEMPARSTSLGRVFLFMTIHQTIKRYAEIKSLSRSVAGVRYKAYLLKFLQDGELKEVTYNMVFDKMIEARHRLSNNHYYQYIIALRGFLKWCSDLDLLHISTNQIKTPRLEENPYHAITQEEYEIIDDYYDTSPRNFYTRRDRLIVRMLWETGVRVSELCALNCEDIGKEPKAMIRSKKSNEVNYIFWSDETHDLLLHYIYGRKNAVFATIKGRITPRQVQRIISKLGLILGFEKPIVPHSFRHGKAHFILKNKGGVKDIQEILRHKNPISSFKYLHLNYDEKKAIAKRFL